MERYKGVIILLCLCTASFLCDVQGQGINTSERTIHGESPLHTNRFISGIVTDEEEKPVSGVTVKIHCHITELGPNKYRWVFSHELDPPVVTTDAQGRFAIEIKEDGLYNLIFYPEEHAAKIVYDVTAGTKDIKVMLEKGGTVTGRVFYVQDDKKIPIPNVEVIARQFNTEEYTHFGTKNEPMTKTDSKGHFIFENLCTKRRDFLRVAVGREAYEPIKWYISAWGLPEWVIFDENIKSKYFEFFLDGEIRALLDLQLIEILGGIKIDHKTATQIHNLLVQIEKDEDNKATDKIIPSVENLQSKPRSTLARYLQNSSLSQDNTSSLMELLHSVGYVKTWAQPQVITSPGKQIEVRLTGKEYLIRDCRFRGWHEMGYPNFPKLYFIAQPQFEKNIVNLKFDLDSWCGIRRKTNQPPCTDGLRKITLSKEVTVSDGESIIIPLWDNSKGAEIYEDEDLLFVTMSAHILPPSSSPQKTKESKKNQFGKRVAEVEWRRLWVTDQFLEDLEGMLPMKGVTSIEDTKILHYIGAMISQDKSPYLNDTQINLLISTAEKYEGTILGRPQRVGVREGNKGTIGSKEAVSYIAGYDKSDEPPHKLIKRTELVFPGMSLTIGAQLSSEDEIELEGTLCIRNFKNLEDRQHKDGYTYQVPRMYNEVFAIDGLSKFWGQTAVYKTQVLSSIFLREIGYKPKKVLVLIKAERL